MARHEVRIRALKEINGVVHVLLIKEYEQLKTKESGERFVKHAGRGAVGGGIEVPIDVRYIDENTDYETIRAEALREFREETGMDAEIGKKPVRIFEKGDGRKVFLFEAFEVTGVPNITDPNIEGIEWAPLWQVYEDYGSHDGFKLYRAHSDMVQCMPQNLTEPKEEEIPIDEDEPPEN